MTQEQAWKRFYELSKEFDEYAGKKLVGLVGFDGTNTILTGPEKLQTVYRNICEQLVECMDHIPVLKRWLPTEGDATYRWTRAAVSLANQMKQVQRKDLN